MTLIAVCVSAMVPSIIFSVETDRITENMNTLSNQLSDLKSEIQNLEFSREEFFEKRFQELSDKMKDLESKVNYISTKEIVEETIQEEIIETEIIADTIIAEIEYSKERLPEGIDTNRYDCEHYIFGVGSDQRKLQTYCQTEAETGLRYYIHNNEKYYCVAMGGAYGIDIGDIWDVTLECGTTFGVILSDYQHPITNIDPFDFGELYERDIYGNIVGILQNYDEEPVCHVLEFIVDMNTLHKSIKTAGTVSALEKFGGLYGNGGNIVNIKYKGRAWNA